MSDITVGGLVVPVDYVETDAYSYDANKNVFEVVSIDGTFVYLKCITKKGNYGTGIDKLKSYCADDYN